MSRINDLIRQVALKDETLAADLQREVAALADRRSFGLNFERHVPEAVELPGRPVRRGDKVRILPPRGERPTAPNKLLWRVDAVRRTENPPTAKLVGLTDESATTHADIADLVVVAEFRDPIYPGLVSTGKVERGGDKPFHTVINAENFHALQALLFTHRDKVDCIYIDPPYNTGAKDWKYNNDYVESDDLYRHSKWLAFMERRLLLAKALLNPECSVLIVTIDEKEYLRLGMLLEQLFAESSIQMISSVINPSGSSRQGGFSRSDEYIFFVFVGKMEVQPTTDDMLRDSEALREIRWDGLSRRGATGKRSARPNLFFPVYLDEVSGQFHSVGEALPLDVDRHQVQSPPGTVPLFPIGADGTEMTWGLSREKFVDHLAKGYVKFGPWNQKTKRRTLYHIQAGTIAAVESGEVEVTGQDENGTLILSPYKKSVRPMTTWNKSSHSAGDHGSSLLRKLLPGRSFPFPKSLYAVEDTLRFFVGQSPRAIVVDFFSGSGTTAHAVMRLNKQDGGRRQCISVTNNEVSTEDQKSLRDQGLRPGDAKWEMHGICDYITKPRIRAAITGTSPDNAPIAGDYKFNGEFPMSDGLEENVEFFTLTYEAPLRVASNRDFERIAPLLWMRAGARGRRIEDVDAGWDVAETYGVLSDLDLVEPFLQALSNQPDASLAFVVTDEDRLFETVVRQLPDGVEPVRLYESYLRNFELEAGRGLR